LDCVQAIDRMKGEAVPAGKDVNVEFMKLDLASLESTKKFIEDFKQKNLPLNLLICNAGIAMVVQGSYGHHLKKKVWLASGYHVILFVHIFVRHHTLRM